MKKELLKMYEDRGIYVLKCIDGWGSVREGDIVLARNQGADYAFYPGELTDVRVGSKEMEAFHSNLIDEARQKIESDPSPLSLKEQAIIGLYEDLINTIVKDSFENYPDVWLKAMMNHHKAHEQIQFFAIIKEEGIVIPMNYETIWQRERVKHNFKSLNKHEL